MVLGLVAGLSFMTAAAGLTAGVHRVIRGHAEGQLGRMTAAVEKSVTAEIDRYRVALADVTAAVDMLDRIDAAGFADLTEPLTRHRLPGAATVSLVVPAETGSIPAVQSRWRDLGDPGLRLQPVAGAGEHFFAVLSRPLDGLPPRLGLDAAAVPEARDVLERSRSTGRMTMSRAYRLLRDSSVPDAQRQLSFVLAAPVTGHITGWVVMALRGTDFLRETLGFAAGEGAEVTLSELGMSIVTVAEWRPAAVDDSLAGSEVTIAVPQRVWRLAIRPTVSLVPPSGVGLPATATALGVALAVLLSVPVIMVWTSRNRAARELTDATAALQADIGRREETERQLRGRVDELVRFAGVVAHDLRAPLATVAGYVDVLREETAGHLNDDHRGFLDRLHAGTRRMHTLLEDLLAYATAESTTLRATEVDLTVLVAEVAQEWRATPSALPPRIDVAALPTVMGDPTLLRQVFDNLIGNAIKYTEPGTPATVEISAAVHGLSSCRIEVADRGIGIPPNQRASVFDAFTRAVGSERCPGTGLGLAIVHRAVQRHGGSIDVDGNTGGGTRFRITLPGVRDSAPANRGPGS